MSFLHWEAGLTLRNREELCHIVADDKVVLHIEKSQLAGVVGVREDREGFRGENVKNSNPSLYNYLRLFTSQ